MRTRLTKLASITVKLDKIADSLEQAGHVAEALAVDHISDCLEKRTASGFEINVDENRMIFKRAGEFWARKNDKGWCLGWRGKDVQFSLHIAPITFPNEKDANDYIENNSDKYPFLKQENVTVKKI